LSHPTPPSRHPQPTAGSRIKYRPEKCTAAIFTEGLAAGGIDIVSIPGGSFTMGSPVDEPERLANEGPQHHVTPGAFSIGVSPVTQAQWLAVVMAHPVRINRDLDPKPSFFKGIDLPVERASPGTRLRSFACASLRSPDEPIG
jgi:hypothetical protein